MKRLLILTLALILALSLAACGGGGGEDTPAVTTTAGGAQAPDPTTTAAQSADPAAGGIKIGVSLPTQREERWVLDREAFERVAGELGVEALIQIADNDAGRQQSQCENLISQGIQALIIAPHDADAAANIAVMAHEAGIPVISYDRLVQNADVDLYVTFDQYRIGQLMGEYVVRNVPGGNIVVLSGDPADPTCVPLKAGAMDTIKPKVDSGEYTIVMEQECRDWEPREALRHAENALTAHNNNIAAFIAPNDGTAGGIIQALAAQGLAGSVVVTGQDAEEDAVARVVEGTQSMTVYFDCAEMAEATLRAAVNMVNGQGSGATGVENNGKIDVPTLGFPPYELNKDNYRNFGFDVQGAGTPAEPPATAMKIGVSLPTQREERWVLDREAFERVAGELGVEALIQIADNDAGRQQSQCENLISQGIQALVIAPHDADAAANIAVLAHDAGIPVISYDRLVQNADVDLYVTFDQYRIGQLMGEYVVRNVPSGNIVVLSGDPADPTCVPLKAGAMDTIKPKVDSGEYTIVMEQECRDWEPREALRHAENALTAHNNDIAAFIAPNDGTAGGIIQALAAQGLAGSVVVTGQDAEEDAVARVVEGTQSMTVYFDCAEMAEATLRASVNMVNGQGSGATSVENNGKIDVPTLGFPPYELNKDNYRNFGF